MEPFIEMFEYCFNICLEISRIAISYNYACLIRKITGNEILLKILDKSLIYIYICIRKDKGPRIDP